MPSITEKMQSELALEEIFEQATEYALNYINNIVKTILRKMNLENYSLEIGMMMSGVCLITI